MSDISQYQTTWRQLTFMKRKSDITKEQFQKHWFTKHVEAVAALPIFQATVLQYEQLYPQEGADVEELELGGGETYDGIVVLDFKSKEDWLALTSNDDYKRTALADFVLFADPTKIKRLLVRRERHVPART